ncbi:MAG: cbb3-type cytochrome c oxidase subunit I [Planctomycetes bacterium]|nr:cbb3-type cytochrome c oxidase subunit I [Planctomycetota bacterium]
MGILTSDNSRVCDTTGLKVCLQSEMLIKLNAVVAVVCLLIGVLAAFGLALTRWETIGLLDPLMYYRFTTVHGLNMLIFWILFMEMAILYFAGTVLLNNRNASSLLSWGQFGLMLIGMGMVNYSVFTGRADVMMTSYVPLRAEHEFYLGTILFAVGALLGTTNFFANLYVAKRDKTYKGSIPLVVFGALAAAIIAVFTILHGAVALVPTWLWSIGMMEAPDAGWYRLLWWGLGHPSQQINVCAMVAVWYLLGTLTVGAKPLNQAVCRTAFLLYILFINRASEHHLLVDPGLSAEHKMWNTSYALYLAVLASMIHGFTVPASLEVAQRKKGHGGLFGWLAKAPWGDPGFAALFVSLVIFGFGGGITGVTLGTHQINIVAHNTLRIPGHFHMTVAGGTSLAFMGLAYYVVPLIFRKEYSFRGLARIQPYIFGLGISIMAIGMTLAGSLGVPRRHPDIDFTDAAIKADLSAASPFMALVGIGGFIAATGALIFILLTVHAVFLGASNKGRAMTSWQKPEQDKLTRDLMSTNWNPEGAGLKPSGTSVLTLLLLAAFAIYYFANWKALADVWHVS